MPKKENLKYLEQFVHPNDFESLLTRCFNTEERTIAVCANKAFRNVIRGYREYIRKPQKERKALCSNIAEWVVRCVEEFFTHNVTTQAGFDTWHNKICVELQEESKKHINWMDNGLPYGVAQYALNATFTNMLLMERWDNHLDLIRTFLHVPVNFISMGAAWEDFKITVPLSKGGFGKYSSSGDEISRSYKSWTHDEYVKFQEDVRGAVPCPVDWNYSARSRAEDEAEN